MSGSIRVASGGTAKQRWVILLIGLVVLGVDNWRLRIRTRRFNDRTVEESDRNPISASERTAAASTTIARTVGKSGGEMSVRTQVVRAQSIQQKPGLRRSKEPEVITNQQDTTSQQNLALPQLEGLYSTKNSRAAEQNQTDTATLRMVGSPTSQHAGPTFVFFIGLEGSGHHLINALMKRSPSQKSLGMRSCAGFKGLHEDILGSMVRPRHKPEHADPSAVFVNATNKLRHIRDTFSKHKDDPNEQLFISINCNGCHKAGLLSYPDFLRPQRELQYVNLHSFYRMCQEAEVNCRHAFIYRDPLQIVRSTTMKRHFNPNKLEAVRLYTLMYQVIHSQLVMFRQYNLGCFGFVDPVGAQKDEDRRRFASLFGWDLSNFTSLINEKVITPSFLTHEQIEELESGKLYEHMKTFKDIHKQVVDYCYETLDAL